MDDKWRESVFVMSKKQKFEKIDHPDHYQAKGMEAIDVIEDVAIAYGYANFLNIIRPIEMKKLLSTLQI